MRHYLYLPSSIQLSLLSSFTFFFSSFPPNVIRVHPFALFLLFSRIPFGLYQPSFFVSPECYSGYIIGLLTIFHVLLTNHLGMLGEGILTNVGNGFWNPYRFKRIATRKCLNSNTRHTIWDSNRSQT